MSQSQLEHLVVMANQIAANLCHGEESEQVAAVASHIVRFWAAPMKAKIVDYLNEGGEGLAPVAAQAVTSIVS